MSDHLEGFRRYVEEREFNLSSIEKKIGVSRNTISNCIWRKDPYGTGTIKGLGQHEDLVLNHFRKYYGYESSNLIEKPTEEFDLENFRAFIDKRDFRIRAIERKLGLFNGAITIVVTRVPRNKAGDPVGLGKNFFSVINYFIDAYCFDNSVDYSKVG